MATFTTCDHCGIGISGQNARIVTIGATAFDLCEKDKEEWEKMKNNFFNIKPVMKIGKICKKEDLNVKKYE